MRVLIIANGESPSETLAHLLATTHNVIIATDGAIHTAVYLGLTPDILTGDFDSVKLEEVRAEYPNLRIIPTPDQDQSDLEKAIAVAQDHGATSITVIGATGGRMDHTLANTALLLNASVPTCFTDDFGTLRGIYNEGEDTVIEALDTSPDDTVSLITLERDTLVSIDGVKWPLNWFHLQPGTRGVSNLALSKSVTVTVHSGSVFVCHMFKMGRVGKEETRRRGEESTMLLPNTEHPTPNT